ncbi:hypothetical protein [Nocardia sp. CNY236]|uniref:hypothetical protein n=1 Tax=Nocardia sp. CNY236 TaxID=1169152 RepID=UPI0004917655|nr:hypothetical protein [Nocardia sp. CNY236]
MNRKAVERLNDQVKRQIAGEQVYTSTVVNDILCFLAGMQKAHAARERLDDEHIVRAIHPDALRRIVELAGEIEAARSTDPIAEDEQETGANLHLMRVS